MCGLVSNSGEGSLRTKRGVGVGYPLSKPLLPDRREGYK
jgi:hypothetical protein